MGTATITGTIIEVERCCDGAIARDGVRRESEPSRRKFTMHRSPNGPSNERDVSRRSGLADLRLLTGSTTLPFDAASREELALRLAGYNVEQIAKLLARTAGMRRAA